MVALRRAIPGLGMVVLCGLAQAQTPPPAQSPPQTADPQQPPQPPQQPVALATGSIGGKFTLASGAAPRQGVVYLEGIPTGTWTLPRERVQLSQRGARFQPDFLVVPIGQIVQIPNDDRLTHSIFSVSPTKPLDLGHSPPGEVRTVTFERPGVVELFCNIHQGMQAVIMVTPSTFYSVLGPDGVFQLGGVPAGRYRLVGYSPQEGQLHQSVEVRPRERTVVTLQLQQPAQAGPPSPRSR